VKSPLAQLTVLLIISLAIIIVTGCAQPAAGDNESRNVSGSGTAQANGANSSPVAKPSGPASSPQATQAPAFTGWPATGNDSVDFFIETALAPYPQGNRSPVVRCWFYDTDVDIYVAGQPTQEDRQAIQACADKINELRSDYGDVYIDIKDSESMANVIIYIGPADQFRHYLAYYDPNKYSSNGIRPSAGDYDLQKGGYKIWYDYNRVPALDPGTTYAVIALSDTGLSQTQRSRQLWRGIASILGAHGNTSKYPDSIFYPAADGPAGYSDRDLATIRQLLGSTEIGPGMTYDMVVQVLINHKTWEEAVDLGSHASTFVG
jgi:hypothetical protein